jgi:hypothetical protein
MKGSWGDSFVSVLKGRTFYGYNYINGQASPPCTVEKGTHYFHSAPILPPLFILLIVVLSERARSAQREGER